MVDKITVTVYAELNQYGEVEFCVNSHTGAHKRKCLHDALSDADIKMTGIEDILNSFRRKLKHVEHFPIESKHTRLYEPIRETGEGVESSYINIESAAEHSNDNLSDKRRKSNTSSKKRNKALVL